MPSKTPTKAQLQAEVVLLTNERDDALIALTSANVQIGRLQTQLAQRNGARPLSKIVELIREATPQGDFLRIGEAIYEATITARADGAGFKVVAPIPNAKPLVTSLSPAGVGYLPEHAVLKLVKA